VKKHEMGGHVARKAQLTSAYMISVGKSEGKTQLGRSRSRW